MFRWFSREMEKLTILLPTISHPTNVLLLLALQNTQRFGLGLWCAPKGANRMSDFLEDENPFIRPNLLKWFSWFPTFLSTKNDEYVHIQLEIPNQIRKELKIIKIYAKEILLFFIHFLAHLGIIKIFSFFQIILSWSMVIWWICHVAEVFHGNMIVSNFFHVYYSFPIIQPR